MPAWTEEHRQHVGRLIDEALERQSIDTTKAANRFGVSVQSIYRARQGTARPAKMLEIARDLGVPEGELLPPPPAEQQSQLDRIEAKLDRLLAMGSSRADEEDQLELIAMFEALTSEALPMVRLRAAELGVEDRAVMDDAMQDAFIALWRHLPELSVHEVDAEAQLQRLVYGAVEAAATRAEERDLDAEAQRSSGRSGGASGTTRAPRRRQGAGR